MNDASSGPLRYCGSFAGCGIPRPQLLYDVKKTQRYTRSYEPGSGGNIPCETDEVSQFVDTVGLIGEEREELWKNVNG